MTIQINQNNHNYIECNNCKFLENNIYCNKYKKDIFYNDNSSTPCNECIAGLKDYINSLELENE